MKIEISLRTVLAIAAAAVALGLFWLGGYDFDRRGEVAVFAALMALVVGGAVAFMP